MQLGSNYTCKINIVIALSLIKTFKLLLM